MSKQLEDMSTVFWHVRTLFPVTKMADPSGETMALRRQKSHLSDDGTCLLAAILGILLQNKRPLLENYKTKLSRHPSIHFVIVSS